MIQFLIVWHAAEFFLINSINVFIYTSVGVIFLLTGAEILFSDIIHSFRLHRRQQKPTKKKIGLKQVSPTWSIFIAAGIILGAFISVYFIVSFYLIDPFTFIELSIFSKFTIAEVITGIILIIFVVILESILPQK